MAKAREIYVCRACGGAQHRWMGKCPDCGAWDALESQRIDGAGARDPQKGIVEAWGGLEGGRDQSGPVATPITADREAGEPAVRLPTGIAEFDRVLGGGIVPGSVALIGGPPGIGKSTLMLQAAGSLARAGSRVLYVSSEESAAQVRLRAARLAAARSEELYILADTNLARIVEQGRKVGPRVVVVDSIQMVYKSDVPGAPGSVAQLRRCCSDLVYLAKESGIAILLVGHVTKDGQLAGPRVIEHLVDAVLTFEGDRYHAHRVVRAVKNRFGSALEIGLFEMTDQGLREAPEGAGVAAVTGTEQARPGSVVCPVMTGTRCVLVEVQALTATGFLGAAKRKCSGLDTNRLAMVIAVLEQHAGLRLADRDVFASAVGGIRVGEPAADLPLLLAIAGAHYKRSLAPATAAVGEVGLGGEVRMVGHVEQRIREGARLGYRRIIAPRGAPPAPGVEVVPMATIGQAISELG